jgi:alpha-amylase
MGHEHHYYNDFENKHILSRVVQKCYLPMNELLLNLIGRYGEKFKVAFSISGSALEQFRDYAPEVIESFAKLARTGNVEFLAETYAHSLASLKSKPEFERQVNLHRKTIEDLFGQKPTTFRNTELIYSDEIGEMVYDLGFDAMLTEGAKHVLGWKSPNHLYSSARRPELKMLLKNFKLSDDIAFRFSHQGWKEWPLTPEKFTGWLAKTDKTDEVVNLFMDYETFGEHQWRETGIFDFMKALPAKILKNTDFVFRTPAEVSKTLKPVSAIHVPYPISWADEERDLTAWLGNEMQDEAFDKLLGLENKIVNCKQPDILRDWYRLQNSDHFYYMCTKWFSDGDVHKYFNPYTTPYEAFINYMNVLSDFTIRVGEQCEQANEKETTDANTAQQKESKNPNTDAHKNQKEKEEPGFNFSFEHLKDISNVKLKKLLKDIDAENLVYALRDAGEDIRDRVLPNLTKSARQEYDQVVEKVKKIKKEDIARGRDKVVHAFNRLFNS